MIGTHGRRGVPSRDVSENGRSKPRGQPISNNSQSSNTFDNEILERSNFDNNVVSTVISCKQLKNSQRKNLIFDTSSSESEHSEDLYYSSRHVSARHLSDYETGESSDKTNWTTIPVRNKKNENQPDASFSPLLPRECFIDSDSSCDDKEVNPRSMKNLKRPIPSISLSDSSDSGVPICYKRSGKRMKLFSSSESSCSGDANDLGDDNLGNDVRNESVGTQEGTLGTAGFTISTVMMSSDGSMNSRRDEEIEENGSDIIQYPTIRGFRDRRIPVIESESESDLVSNSHTVIGRRIPVIISEDEASSSDTYTGIRVSLTEEASQRVNSELGIHGIRRRRRRRRTRRRSVFPPRENEMGSTVNVRDPESTNLDVRSRLVVESDNMSPDSGSYNVWEVNIQVEETDDEVIPLSNGRRVLGRRTPVVESEDDFDSVSNPNNNEIIILDGRHEVNNRLESNVINRRRMNGPTVSTDQNVRRTLIPQVQIVAESSNSEDDIRPRVLSNRLVRTVSTDDSSSILSTDSEDNDSSTSSSSSLDSDDTIPIRNYGRRNNRPIPTIVDYDYEDFAHYFDVNIRAPRVGNDFANGELQNENSSDTDGESEKCPICLTGFKTQQVGKPKTCEHKFCSLCIKEWATKNNTCPVDRKVFDALIVYDKIDGNIITEVPVVKPAPQYNDSDVELLAISISSDEFWYSEFSDGDGPDEICSVCGNSYRPHRMISCDSCNSVYHLECLDPPLRDFPTVNWYCPSC